MLSPTSPCRDDRCEMIRERFVGCLLGSFAGDALGMPLEGMPAWAIARTHGVVEDLLDARMGRGSYTDDTEMTLIVADSLVARGGLDVDDLAGRLARGADPRRGYTPGTWQTLQAIAGGTPWQEADHRRSAGGSFGNAAAARVAPVALLHHRDLERCADAARRASGPTQSHPLGRGGAVVQALALALSLRWAVEAPAEFTVERYLEIISDHLLDNECLFVECFEKLVLMLERHPGLPLESGSTAWLERAEAVAAVLGNDTRTFQSVPATLYAFLAQRDSCEETLITAVSLGGDTDTIAAMAGALAGAHLGVRAVPERWTNGLEGGPRGRDYAVGRAEDLFLLWLDRHADECLEPAVL